MPGCRAYLIAPADCVAFSSDSYEIGNTRYDFLKIPYYVILEFHKALTAAAGRICGKSGAGGMKEAVGFCFNRLPEVKAAYRIRNGKLILMVTEFACGEPSAVRGRNEKKLLSAVLIDSDYNGSYFSVTDAFFGEEITEAMEVKLSGNAERIMITYIDIYGNECSEMLQRRCL